jgi:hypothetical protein
MYTRKVDTIKTAHSLDLKLKQEHYNKAAQKLSGMKYHIKELFLIVLVSPGCVQADSNFAAYEYY